MTASRIQTDVPVGTSRSFSAEAMSTSTSSGRITPSGAFEDTRAPT